MLLTGSLVTFAQIVTKKADIKSGPVLDARRSTLNSTIGRNNDGYFITRTEKGDMFMELIDYNLTTKKSFIIKDQEINDKKCEYYTCFFLENSIYIIFRNQNRKENNFTYYSSSFNISEFKTEGSLVELCSAPYTAKGTKVIRGDINIRISNDFNKLLIYYDLPNSKNENESFHCIVYDPGMVKNWEKSIELSYASKDFISSKKDIDNDGNFYLIGRKFLNKTEEKESADISGQKNKCHLLTFRNKGTEFKDFEISLSDKYIFEVQIEFNSVKNIIASGLYSEDKVNPSAKGAFYFEIEYSTQNMIKSNFKEFPDEILNKNHEADNKKKKENLRNFELDDLIYKEDGSTVLIAEQYSEYNMPITKYGPNGQVINTTEYHFYYEDILVINFDKNGEMTWACKIPKFQHTINDAGAFSSYVCAEHNNKLYFIYNDHPKNILNQNSGKIFPMGRGPEVAVAFVEIMADGKITKELLFSQEKDEIIIRPKVCKDAKEGEFFLFSERLKDYQFSRVIIN